MTVNRFQAARLKRNEWRKELQELPTGDVVKLMALSALPESKRVAVVETALIAGSAAVAYVLTGTWVPTAVAAATAALGSAVANALRKDCGETSELLSRISLAKEKLVSEAEHPEEQKKQDAYLKANQEI